MVARILLLGYGNIDRQDDGVAWHILKTLSQYLNLPEADLTYLDFPFEVRIPSLQGKPGDGNFISIDLWFVSQLTPELAEIVSKYETICFIDAHTGNIPEDTNFKPIKAGYQASPFTHHLTPQSCLELARVMYGQAPESHIMSVRGYEFGFSNQLSEKTGILANEAAKKLEGWLKQKYMINIK